MMNDDASWASHVFSISCVLSTIILMIVSFPLTLVVTGIKNRGKGRERIVSAVVCRVRRWLHHHQRPPLPQRH